MVSATCTPSSGRPLPCWACSVGTRCSTWKRSPSTRSRTDVSTKKRCARRPWRPVKRASNPKTRPWPPITTTWPTSRSSRGRSSGDIDGKGVWPLPHHVIRHRHHAPDSVRHADFAHGRPKTLDVDVPLREDRGHWPRGGALSDLPRHVLPGGAPGATAPGLRGVDVGRGLRAGSDRKSTRLNSSHLVISYAVFCLKKKNTRLNSRHPGISYAVFCLKKNKQCA